MPRSALQELAALTGESLWAIDEKRLAAPANQNAPEPAKSIAVVNLQGPLIAKSREGYYRTIPGMDAVQRAVLSAAYNPEVAAIVLNVDSPGGTVAGTMETAAAVREAAAKKPVIAMVDTLGASAAYWIVSQASEIVLAPSAEVGSIGVLLVHWDESEFLKMVGSKVTIVRSGDHKAEGNPFEPLSDETKAYFQGLVDQSHAAFVKDVAAGRRVSQAAVRENFGKGRTLDAQAAVAAGMADRVATMREVLNGLIKPVGARRSRRSFAF